jgi:septal ring factor EnvC (AmiA/AmiB activator)
LDDVEHEQEKLNTAENVLQEKRDEIQRLAAVKRAAFEDVSGEVAQLQKRVQVLASKAENVRSLLDSLEQSAPDAPSRKPQVYAQKTPDQTRDAPISVAVLERLGLPANGRMVQKYGDKLPTGRKAEGITLRTRTAAQVVAPSDALIEYAGPFRSYGQMLILRTGDGYHIVLYGLSDIYGTLGQSVLAGEPIGRMTDRSDVAPDLHMELRKDGTSQDPEKWMSRKAG